MHILIGVSDYAHDQKGEFIYLKLMESDATFVQNDVFVFIESIKAASHLYDPVRGKVIAVNYHLAAARELVVDEPYENGLMIALSRTSFWHPLNTLKCSNQIL